MSKNISNVPNAFDFGVMPTIGVGTHTVVFNDDVSFKQDKNGKDYLTVSVTKPENGATRTLVGYPDPLRIWLVQILTQLDDEHQVWASPLTLLKYLSTNHIPLTMRITTVSKELTDANGNTTTKKYTNVNFKKEEN